MLFCKFGNLLISLRSMKYVYSILDMCLGVNQMQGLRCKKYLYFFAKASNIEEMALAVKARHHFYASLTR